MTEKLKWLGDLCTANITINGDTYFCDLPKNHRAFHFTSESKFWIKWRE